MRLGLHTGEVIAGITGTNIVRYDIYGADVTLANYMESGGKEGRINVSEVTRDLIEENADGKFIFE
jgi:class 3 adenylate cyclase